MTSISLEEARLVIEEDRLKQERRRARREKMKTKFLSLLKTQELHAEIARRKERTEMDRHLKVLSDMYFHTSPGLWEEGYLKGFFDARPPYSGYSTSWTCPSWANGYREGLNDATTPHPHP